MEYEWIHCLKYEIGWWHEIYLKSEQPISLNKLSSHFDLTTTTWFFLDGEVWLVECFSTFSSKETNN